ncbi:MAG: phage tail protein [Ignavibacteriae bacterium]|nr:phage tail protein [Ignavibacteriota bacterium]
MATPFLGQIITVGFYFAPVGYALCNGQLLSISEYEALFTLLGTTYGGDGVTTFGLPDLQGRAALGQGQGPGLTNRTIGEKAGSNYVTLLYPQMAHGHGVSASKNNATQANPNGLVYAQDGVASATNYSNAAPNTTMNPGVITPVGGSQPHDNMQPSLAINFCIATEGIYPSPS